MRWWMASKAEPFHLMHTHWVYPSRRTEGQVWVNHDYQHIRIYVVVKLYQTSIEEGVIEQLVECNTHHWIRKHSHAESLPVTCGAIIWTYTLTVQDQRCINQLKQQRSTPRFEMTCKYLKLEWNKPSMCPLQKSQQPQTGGRVLSNLWGSAVLVCYWCQII